MNPDPALPVACTLAAGDRTDRVKRWRALAARALLEAETTPDGVRLRFAPLPDVAAQLDELAAAERACCGFATWAVRRTDGELVLDVSAAGEGIAVVRALGVELARTGAR